MALQTLTVPPDVKQLFSHRHAEAGFGAGCAWAFQRSQLAVWDPQDASTQPSSHRLPYASGSRQHFVCIMPDRSSGRLGVLLVTEDGNAALWPDFANRAAMEPLTSRIPGRVLTLAAPATSAGSSGADSVLAAAGMEDGSIQLLGDWGAGGEPTWRPLTQQAQEGEGSLAASTSSSMLGRLGSVLRSRPQPAPVALATAADGLPAAGLRFGPDLQLASQERRRQLLVVRGDGVECWALGPRGESLLLQASSVAQELEAKAGQGPVRLLGLACQPQQPQRQQQQGEAAAALVVVAGCPGGMLVVSLAGEAWRVAGWHRVAEAPPGEAARVCAAVGAGASASSALVWEVGGQAIRLDLSTGKGAALGALPAPLLAATWSTGAGAWLLLDGTGALHRLGAAGPAPRSAVRVETSQPAEAAGMAAGAAGVRATDAVFQVLNAACQGHLGVASMAQQLASLGALRGMGTTNPVAKFSRHVLDTLPKIFGAGGETVGDQLAGKLALHNVLLQCLSDGGCLAQMHPGTLRTVFEDGQKLRALMDLRELESKLQEQRKGAEDTGQTVPFPLHEATVAAGRRCMAHVLGGGDRTPWEVFYACPSATVSAFLGEAGGVAAGLASAPGAVAAQQEALAQVAKGVQVALGGAAQQRGQYRQWFPHPFAAAAAGVDEAEWVVGSEVRATLQALAEASLRLYPLLSREAPSRLADCVSLTLDLSERLLNAYAAALAAAAPKRRPGLKVAYDAARDASLGHLLRHAQLRCRQGAGEGEALLQRVESLAEAHAGYALLFDACEFTGDRERLYELMAHLAGDGLAEPLAVYVFRRLMAEGRRSELLDLPPQFDGELAAWLGDEGAQDAPQRLQIRWLHDLRVGDYAAACRSLWDLVGGAGAQQQQQQQGQGQSPQGGGGGGLSVRSARRLLALDRLAAWAASPGWRSEVAGDVAAVAEGAGDKQELLLLQARLGGSDDAAALLDPATLMEAALGAEGGQGVGGVIVALEAFALAGRDFQQTHRALLDAAWQRAAAATSWEELGAARQSSTEEGWLAQLAETPLFSAAAACYSAGGGVLQGVVPPEQVYALLAQAAVPLSPAATKALRAAFQEGCNAVYLPPSAEGADDMEA